MVKVVYDHQVFGWQRYGGISRYIYEVASRLYEDRDLDVEILAIAYMNEYLKSCKTNLVKGLPVPYIPKYQIQKILGEVNNQISKFLLSNHAPAILHQTYYNFPHLAPKGTKVVITVHDMTHEKLTEFFSTKDIFNAANKTSLVKQEAVKKADRIICVSENTKKDLIELMEVDQDKISVVYHGYSLNRPSRNQHLEKTISQPYIFYVGERGGYKNFHRLLEAYASSKQLQTNFQVVCFGGGQETKEEASHLSNLGISAGKISYCSGSDKLLANLYQNAALFVYPSLYEGFGMPLLEAMALDCPVACSNNSCLPEVVDKAAELFDPYEPESIAAAIEKVLFSPERATDLVNLGTERVKQFSWEACAEQTKQVYLSML